MVVGKNFRIGIYLVLILFIIGSLLNRFPNSLTKDDDLTTLDTPPIPQASSKAKTAYNKNVQALEEKEFTVDPDEKFLAYNTHSGYHNQRISLENALLLAKLLNRTLLMPPALLGTPLPWAKFDKMHERLFLSTKKGLQHCSNVPKDFPLPAECLNYNSYTTVSWDFLLNVEPIRQSQKIIDRLDNSYEWIENKLSLDIKKDVLLIKDTKLWDYRIFDVLDSDIDNSNKYARFLYTDILEKDPHKLIYFGSLFGAFRVVPQKPSSMEYLKFIRKHLIPNNPLMLKAANSIVNKLGGLNNFVGVHIRATDGFFMKFARLNIDNIYHSLTDEYTNLDPEEINMLEGGTHEQDVLIDDSVDLGSNNPHNNVNQKNGSDNNNNNNNESKNKRENLQLKKREISQNVNNNDLFVKKRDLRNIKCNKPLHPSDSGVNTVIFIATDIKSPRTSPLLFKFFNTFPCTFVLGDFEEDLEEISGIVNSNDLTPLTEYLIPTLDALISSKGHSFYGTEKSTFSKYIEKTLHPISRGEGLNITFYLD